MRTIEIPAYPSVIKTKEDMKKAGEWVEREAVPFSVAKSFRLYVYFAYSQSS